MLDPGSAARAFRLASRSKDFRVPWSYKKLIALGELREDQRHYNLIGRVHMATGYRLHSIDKRFQRLLDRLDDAEQAQLVRDGQA